MNCKHHLRQRMSTHTRIFFQCRKCAKSYYVYKKWLAQTDLVWKPVYLIFHANELPRMSWAKLW